MQKKRLLKLADFLETVPRRALAMNSWVERVATKPEGKKPGECGFAGCAMGWAAHAKLFRGLKLEQEFGYDGQEFGYDGNAPFDLVPEYHGERGFEAAQELFELSPLRTSYLFEGDYYYEEYKTATPTPKQVAKRIRKFVEAGGIPASD